METVEMHCDICWEIIDRKTQSFIIMIVAGERVYHTACYSKRMKQLKKEQKRSKT